MKKALAYLDKHFEEILLILATIAMIILITVQVFSRRFFNASLAWSEEISRYVFIWTVWMGVPYAVIKGRHIRLAIVRDALNDTGKYIQKRSDAQLHAERGVHNPAYKQRRIQRQIPAAGGGGPRHDAFK